MKRQWLGWNYALLIIGLVILSLLVIDFNSRMVELRRLQDQAEREAVQVTNMILTQSYLETQIAYATSDAAVYEWAYQEGRWIRPGDIPVVPLPPEGSSPQPTPMAIPETQTVSNWQIWLSLFLDSEGGGGRP